MRETAVVIGISLLAAQCVLPLPASAQRGEAQLLRYVVRADPFEVQLTLADGTKAVKRLEREATHFLLLAERGWSVPDGAGDTRIRCEIRWDGFPPDWHLVNSFGVDQRTQQFETTLGDLRKAVFAGGDFRVNSSKNGIILATRGTWKFADSDAVALLDRIAAVQSAIWQDRGLSGHVVYLLPTDKAAGWGGEARTRSTVLEVSRETSKPTDVAEGFAHEIFHEWNAHRLNRTGDETLYWFSEGVTDYYAVMTLWRSEVWSFERVLDYFNTVARQYFGSPVRNYTAARMVERRKSDFNAERLPYQQGFLLASHWNRDGLILDQALRQLMKTNGEPLSHRRIASALAAAGIATASDEIERFVLEGQTIALRPRIWGDCAMESAVDIKQFDIGFDVEQSRKSGIVHGIREDSAAWRAGVRDGQRWSPIDLVWGDPGYLAELEINDERGTRRAKYYPAASITTRAPQYAVNSATPCLATPRASGR